jgi:6-phosphogluconolactonase (cycloisomerase 2 family)
MRHIDRRTILSVGVTGAALTVLPGTAAWASTSSASTSSASARPTDEGAATYAYVSSNSFSSKNPIGLTVFRRDAKTGALTLVQQVTTDFPSWVTTDPSQRFVYVCYALSSGTQLVGKIAAFAIDPHDGTLTLLNEVSLGATGPAQVAVSPDGRYALVANYYHGQYVVLPIAEDGQLGPVSSDWQDTGSGPQPRQQDGPHPHAVVFDPRGRFLATADLGNDEVQTFRLVDGVLKHVSTASVASGSGARHVAFSRDGETLYVVGELSGIITAFDYDPVTGALGRAIQTISTMPSSYTGVPSGAEITVHSSGDFLYASNRGSQTVAGYRIDRWTGELSLIGFATQGVDGPTNFAIDPNGRWLYVNSSGGNEIVQFDIDAKTGELTPTGLTTPLFAANVMAF